MTTPRVTYVDDEPNGLAVMVGGLIEANLAQHPRRAGLLRRAVVDLVAIDADVAVSLGIERREVRVANGTADGRAWVRVTADSLSLVELAGAPLRLGLPDVFRREGRVIARKVLGGQMQIEGLVRHLLTVSRVTRLLSVVCMDPPVVVVPPRRALLATVVVAAAIATVVFGGFVVGGALSRTVGAPVEVAGVIRVQPLSGWEVASRSQSPPRVRLTRGGGNLDIGEFPFQGSAEELVAAYVRDVLEPEASRLSVSRETQTIRLGSGLVGVRIGYVGLFGRSSAPIEGEVTAVVSPNGVGAVFDGWGAEGVLRYMLDDVHAMIGSAVIT